MKTWLPPKKAAQYIRKNNPASMIGERTLRNLLEQGFPCIKSGTRSLINVSDFEENLKLFLNRRDVQPESNIPTGKIRKVK